MTEEEDAVVHQQIARMGRDVWPTDEHCSLPDALWTFSEASTGFACLVLVMYYLSCPPPIPISMLTPSISGWAHLLHPSLLGSACTPAGWRYTTGPGSGSAPFET